MEFVLPEKLPSTAKGFIPGKRDEAVGADLM